MKLATKERSCDCGERQVTGGKDPNEAVMEKLSMMAGSVSVANDQESPLMTTRNSKRKIHLEFARAGAEEDSQTDNLVINPGKNRTVFLSVTEFVTIHLKQNNLINTSV